MEKFLKIGAKVLLFLLLLVIVSFYLNVSVYKELIKEDGLIEYLTAIILLAISVSLIIRIGKIRGSKGYIWLIFNIFMALGLFFGFGEEISWGQRIFDVTSSEFFMENNAQEETNLHNLTINGININMWIFSYGFSILFGIYFFLLLLFYKKNKFIKKILNNLGIPVPKVTHSLIFIIIAIAIMAIPEDKKWELLECLFAVVLLLIFIEPYNITEKLFIGKKATKTN